MTRSDHQMNFRMPREMVEELRVLAHLNGRSMTAEIVHRLRESIAAEKVTIELVLPTETERGLREIAAHRGVSVDAVVEDAMRAFLGVKP